MNVGAGLGGPFRHGLTRATISAIALAGLPAGFAAAEEHAPEPRSPDRVCDDAAEYADPFTDVGPDNVHYRNVLCAAAEGVTQGYGDDTFRPARPVQRDQMASFIARWVEAETGERLDDNDADFEDVSEDNIHGNNINKLAHAGIVLGQDEGTYNPGRSVTRQAMTAFIHRARSYMHDGDAQNLSTPLAFDEDYFPDVDEDNPFFDNIDALASVGIASGYADGTFGPGNPVRRDQMASFVLRAFDFLGGGHPVLTVTIISPTSDDPDSVAAGEGVDVEFATNAVAGDYTIELGAENAWDVVGAGEVTTADVTTTVTVPEDADAGALDLRVTIDDYRLTAIDTELRAVIVIDGAAPESLA